MEIAKPTTAPNNLRKVAYAGVSFTALFSGYIAAQNVASSVYPTLGFGGLGTACVLTIYLFLGLGSIIASYVKKSLSYRAGFVIGAAGYGSIVIASLITATCENNKDAIYCGQTFIYIMNIGMSMLVGLGASIIWLTQSDYVDAASTEETKGSYNGVFWSLMQLSQILSAVLISVLLPISTILLYCVLLGFVALAIAMFSFTPGLDVVAKPSNETFGESIAKFFGAFKAKKSLFLLPGMMAIGVAISFYANFLTVVNREMPLPSTVDANNKEAVDNYYSARLGYIFISLAFGEIAAGLTVGRFADAFNKVKVFHVMLVVPEIALVLTFLAYFTTNYYLLLASAFFWGYTDTALNSIVGILIGSFFNGAMEYFCLMRFFTGIGCAVLTLLALAFSGNIVGFGAITGAALLAFHVWFLATKDDNISSKKDYEEPLTAASETA